MHSYAFEWFNCRPRNVRDFTSFFLISTNWCEQMFLQLVLWSLTRNGWKLENSSRNLWVFLLIFIGFWFWLFSNLLLRSINHLRVGQYTWLFVLCSSSTLKWSLMIPMCVRRQLIFDIFYFLLQFTNLINNTKREEKQIMRFISQENKLINLTHPPLSYDDGNLPIRVFELYRQIWIFNFYT